MVKTSLTIQSARDLIRRAKLRSTPSRIAVLQLLGNASSPQSHTEIADALVPQGYDKSTLYRCLVEMTEAGVLARMELGDHAWRFALYEGESEGQHVGEHPHFVCVDCGKVECLPDVKLQLPSKRGSLTKSQIIEVTLKGHCRNCIES